MSTSIGTSSKYLLTLSVRPSCWLSISIYPLLHTKAVVFNTIATSYMVYTRNSKETEALITTVPLHWGEVSLSRFSQLQIAFVWRRAFLFKLKILTITLPSVRILIGGVMHHTIPARLLSWRPSAICRCFSRQRCLQTPNKEERKKCVQVSTLRTSHKP